MKKGLLTLWRLTQRLMRRRADIQCLPQTEHPIPPTYCHGGYTVRLRNPEDQDALSKLFQQCFNSTIDPVIWEWKYRGERGFGVVLEESGDIIGHSGLLPRSILCLGSPEVALQLADVMIASQGRRSLSRKGPFYHLIYCLWTEYVGPGNAYERIFGFPTVRHYKAGMRSGLYSQTDSLYELRWQHSGEPSEKPVQVELVDRAEPVSPENKARINSLWNSMKEDLQGAVCGTRDSDWVQYRYINHPSSQYTLYFVGPAPHQAFIVLKHRDDAMELLDVVAAKADFPAAIAAARQIAHKKGQDLVAWATPTVKTWCEGSNFQEIQEEVVIPGNMAYRPDIAMMAANRWWLMGGDTDFR